MSKIKARSILGPCPERPRLHRGRRTKNARQAFAKRVNQYHRVWNRIKDDPRTRRFARSLTTLGRASDKGSTADDGCQEFVRQAVREAGG